MPPTDRPFRPEVELSVVSPAHNEEGNVGALVEEIRRAVEALGIGFEVVIVDDGSTDGTRARVVELMATRPWLRCIAMTKTARGKGAGQSAAFLAGFAECRGRLVATLDADLQNDPADISRMINLMRERGADMVQGDRSGARKDNFVRRIGSVVGRKFRLWLLGDSIRDTGCSLRVMRREIAVRLPLEFRGMHRFIPVTARHLGYRVEEMRVNHRARMAGETKYGMGIVQRAIPGLIDLLAVRYMRSRRRATDHAEVERVEGPADVEVRAGRGPQATVGAGSGAAR